MVALDKRKLRREIERARRVKFKARLVELRELIKAARESREAAITNVRTDCAQKRIDLRQSCQSRATLAKVTGAAEVARRKSTLLEEKGFEQQIRNADRPRKLRTTSIERRQESDDEVRSSLDPEMVGVFDAVKKHIKGSPRKSRTEAFLQWSEENPGEVYDLLQHDADRYLAQLLAEQERTQRELRRSSVAGVPF
jgi:hypothetical protein